MIAADVQVGQPAAEPAATTGSTKPTGAQLAAAFPPRPVAASWPATEARRSAVMDRVLAAPFALDNPLSQRNRRLGVLAVPGWLREQPGDSWQQRWRGSGAEDQPDWRLLVGTDRAKPLPHLTPGLMVLICADVIRPSLEWLLRFAPARHNLAAEMARTRDPAAFAELAALCRGQVGLQCQQQALNNVAVILAVKGANVAAVRVGDCLELLATAARNRVTNDRHAESPLFYQLLRAHGDLGAEAPAAIEMFFGRGQPSCEQLIDRYRIACRPVRDVLVDYLRERQPAVDFSSLQNLAYLLGKLFWADLEAHHPGIDSLQLPRDVAAAWKQRVLTRPKAIKGQAQVTGPRPNGRSVLTAVRAFYLDLAEWADDDPARWGPWAVRCPVSASDASHKKARLHRKSRMDTRTRERLPVLPKLVAWVAAERGHTAELLAAAERTPPGQLFTAAGTTLRRAVLKTQTSGRVWAEDPDTGLRRDLSFEEHRGFWTWAMVEVLRHTGIRIEELTELSHHALIQYRLPTSGELIPLLQIVPSKTDAERLQVSHPNSPTCCRASSPASAAIGPMSQWWCPTTKTNASTTRPCRFCSNGGADSTTAPSARPCCAPTSTTRSPRSASKTPPASRCATPSTTFDGCSSPTPLPTACHRTSPSSSPAIATSTPPWDTRPSTPRK